MSSACVNVFEGISRRREGGMLIRLFDRVHYTCIDLHGFGGQAGAVL
jgi:hypothetical protein